MGTVQSSLLMAGLLALAGPVASISADDLMAARETLYEGQLSKLAALVNPHHQDAEGIRRWAYRDPSSIYILRRRDHLDPSAAPPPKWWQQFVELRKTYADDLFDLAGQAIKANNTSLAFEMICDAVGENPDHSRARAILGYAKIADRWLTAYEAKRIAKGEVFHDKFGWIAAADVERYEKGERKSASGFWRSAEEDAKQHATIKTGWRIETEHYVVTTDVSLEAGVALAKKFELLNQVWRQVFVAYWLPVNELAKRYAGSDLPQHQSKQHQVVYFRSRDEYNSTLRPMQPLIDKTIGYYAFDNHTAYFFVGDDADDAVLFHEGTHQLFQETLPVSRDLARKSNYWIVEAVACYMESLTIRDEFCTVGGESKGRMVAARQRLFSDGFYVPMAEMIGFNRDTLQHDRRVAKIYSESAGLANFFMHANKGRYRQALMGYLTDVYSGKADTGTLAKLTGKSDAELDAAYRDYLDEVENR
jgi:hypothetical protein